MQHFFSYTFKGEFMKKIFFFLSFWLENVSKDAADTLFGEIKYFPTQFSVNYIFWLNIVIHESVLCKREYAKMFKMQHIF